ncbi:MAG: hydantoinase/oxoprolinase family protein [Candidatus Omnitrophota bacterium]
MIRIGVDTGGTFTDFVFYDGEKLQILKLPSTPQNPALSILDGIKPHIERSFELIHGTTVSTNAFLQKKMAKTAFVCTRGFEHILYIGRQNRSELFSLEAKKSSPLVPLSLCFGVNERTLKDGTIKQEFDKTEGERLVELLNEQDVQSVGIVFLHSYKNPENEIRAAEVFRAHGFYVTASHEIIPEYREYERAAATILNSALQPVISDYVNNLKDTLTGKKFYIIQSNGGILSPDRVIKEPIHTIVSGPAGGVIAAKKIAELSGEHNLVTLDMGGTSTDVSIVKNGEITLTRNGTVEHLPLRFPLIDIATVGAGGGSIARVDRGGVLQVGPESAGADPGPACYGKSDLATVTDAFVVTGAILPEMFLGGKMKIYPKHSVHAIKDVGQRIGKGLFETAEGIIRISISSMERALRSVTLEKGEDPRFYTLLPFGGAGGLVAALLAERLGMTRILIPPFQGVFSALGMLMADFKKEISRPVLKRVHPDIASELDVIFSLMELEAREIMEEEGYDQPQIYRLVDIRYRGQGYELTIPFVEHFLTIFHEKHKQYYSYMLDDANCEIVNARVLGVGKNPELKWKPASSFLEPPVVAYRKEIYFKGEFRHFNIYNRNDLHAGHELENPSIVVSADGTAIIPGEYTATVDSFSNILLKYNT